MLTKRPPTQTPPQTVRIIGGSLRGSRLPVPNLSGLRPTPDRVRETLFNWLRPVLPGSRVLDLFAGSGALGLEALSQGAAWVDLIERDPRAADSLRTQLSRLKVETQGGVRCASAPEVLDSLEPGYDLILLDPPYAAALWEPCLAAIARRALLKAEGRIYLEWPEPGAAPATPGWRWLRQSRAGAVGFGLLQADG